MLDNILCSLLFNNIFYLTQVIYVSASVFLAVKYLLRDLKHQFLGVTSAYFVMYAIGCFFTLITYLGWTSGGMVTTCTRACFLYLVSTWATYNGCLFLIKKYQYTDVRTETFLTFILELCLFVGLTVVVFNYEKHDQVLEVNYFIDYWYTLNNKHHADFPTRDLLLLFRAIPLTVLGVMWFKSITKSYNHNENSYFPKSANKPISLFLLYQFCYALTPFVQVSDRIEILVVILVLEFLKFYYLKSMLHWLTHPDMEVIEKNTIRRSEKKWF